MKTQLVLVLTGIALSVSACSTCRKRKAAPRDAAIAATAPLDRVPPGLKIEATHVRLKAPMSIWTGGAELRTSEVIELTVTSTEPIAARALDPVLRIGDRAITHYRYADPRTLVFTEPAPATLPAGPITFHWGATGPAHPTGATLDRKSLLSIDR